MEVEKMEKHFYVVFKPGFTSDILKLPGDIILKEGVEHVSLRSATTRTSEVEDIWRVEIYRYMKHVYLNTGWDKFVEIHRLNENDFLLFKHDGGTCFSVRIFHGFGLEKVYDSNHDTVKEEDDDDIDDDGETSNSKHQKIHHSPPGESIRGRKLKDCDIINERIKSFSSQNPYITRLIKDYNVHSKYNMNIPKIFAKIMLNEEAEKVTLNLRNSEGRTYEVELRRSCRSQYFIQPSGWKRFVVDNSLKAGDVCIFELVAAGQHSVWQVHVFSDHSFITP